MTVNDAITSVHREHPEAFPMNALPIELVEPLDVTNAVAWLVSDEARYVTGVALPVDAGFTNRK